MFVMRRLLIFFLGMIVGGGLVGFGFKYHVLYTNKGVVLIPKAPASLASPYADVRNWRPSDWQAHPELTHAVVAHGRGDLISQGSNDFLREFLRKAGSAEKIDDDKLLQ